jgi:hypothetical protein
MFAKNAARAAPAGTGRDPRVTDRHSGAIEIIPASTAGHAAATDAHHHRAWWRAEPLLPAAIDRREAAL